MDRARFASLRDDLQRQGIAVDAVLQAIQEFTVETPSWGYGNSGTRFKVFPWPGAARTLFEKLEDAAMVHRLTGACPGVAIHIPWDLVQDWASAQQHAASLGMQIGAVNPNLFQDDAYRLGSLCHPDAAVRRQAITHVLECIRIARQVHSDVISLWLADGTNYPGQDDFRRRRQRLLEAVQEIYAALPAGMRLLIEYKFFEPAFYQTALPDWGPPCCCVRSWGRRRRCWSIRDITPRARIWRRLWRSCWMKDAWAAFTSMIASMPTMT